MEEQEACAPARRLAVALVESVDRGDRGRQDLVVTGHALFGSVEPVRQQCESQIAIAVAEVVHLEATDQCFGLVFAGQQHRHHDECAHARGHTIVEVEARQPHRAEHPGDHHVDEVDGEVGGRAEREDRDRDEPCPGGTSVARQQQRYGQRDRTQEHDRCEVAGRGVPHVRTPQPCRQRHVHVELSLEGEPPVGDQVVAGIVIPGGLGRFALDLLWDGVCQVECRSGNLDLGHRRAATEFLDGLAVAVARREVHVAEGAARAKQRVDHADALDELSPIERGDQAHARDHIADRHVHGRLALVLESHRLVGGRALRHESILQPTEGRGDRRVLIAKALEELHERGCWQCRSGQLAQRHDGDVGARVAEAQQAVGELVGGLTRLATGDDLFRQSPEVLDEEDAQGDCDRPQLADRQRLDRLVCLHHPAQAVGVEAAVGVGDVRPCQPQHAGIAGEVPLQQLWELVVVVPR